LEGEEEGGEKEGGEEGGRQVEQAEGSTGGRLKKLRSYFIK